VDLNPAQHRVEHELLDRGHTTERPTFDPAVAAGLRARLEEALAPAAAALAEPLWVGKTALAQVHSCEANYLAERRWDGLTLAMAVGEVTHRAIRLAVATEGDPTPLALVDHALTEATADEAGNLGGFLAALAPARRNELRADAGNGVATFLECWPPLHASWWPRPELRVRADLCGGQIVLSGKIDLSLGRAIGPQARCLFVDLKTGGHYPAHLDDLRFYALIQALRIGVPPFRVASYYLDSASFAAEDVTEDTLEIALRRTVDGARKMAQLQSQQREPAVTPCPRCRFCRIRAECPGAREWDQRNDEP